MPPIDAPRIALVPILPEIVLVGTAILIMLIDAIRPARDHRPAALLALAGIAGSAAAALALWNWGGEATVLGHTVATDRFSVFFRLVILASAAIATVLATHYLRRTGEGKPEFFTLLLFSASGMTLLAAAADLIVAFLALELLSLSLYVLAGYSFRRLTSQEAGMKYFLLGAFSSAFFLYGIALAYGASGTTSLNGIGRALSGQTGELGLALGAGALLLVGFAFKVGAVPFHMWTPDVYQGAPTPVTAFMSAGTKVAGFAALLRVTASALGPVSWDISPALWWLAALSMVGGSLLAIAQTDVKRMLAYSSIAHAGFVLVGVTAANQAGISGAMFYLAAYAAMILGAFGVVMLVSGVGEERTSLSSYAGLVRRSPLLAGLMALFLLSLAGIPPTAGFIAKVLVFGAAIEAGQTELVIVGVLASVVAAFFYIRLIVLAYMQDPEEAGLLSAEPVPAMAVAVMGVLTLLFGVLPGILLNVLKSASVLRF